MATRRQRRRWAAQGGRPRDARAQRPANALTRLPDLASLAASLDGQTFEASTLEGLAEALRAEGHTAEVDGDTLRFAPFVPGLTAEVVPSRVIDTHHDNRAQRRARLRGA